jgi:predicted transcriptional regulator
MTPRKPEYRVQSLLDHHGAEDDPEALICRLCNQLLANAGESAPVDLEVLASFRNAEVTLNEQAQAEIIYWDGDRFKIKVRAADSDGRRRFSVAHGIVHTWFFETDSTVSGSTSHWSRDEEQLCDLGAAALLLPESEFRAKCPSGVTMGDILELAAGFQASAEATALRAATLSPEPMAMVVLEMAVKPAEVKKMARQRLQPSFLGLEPPAVAPKLRVVKSFGQGLAFIPRYKSVDDGSALAEILTADAIDFIGPTGLIGGDHRVSAMNLPMWRDGAMVDRVIALIAEDRRSGRASRNA